MNFSATFLLHSLSKISTATGMSNLMRPKRSALTLVQRQTAASRSTRPSMRLQQVAFSFSPIRTFAKFSTFAHARNFKASLGQVLFDFGGLTFGVVDGDG